MKIWADIIETIEDLEGKANLEEEALADLIEEIQIEARIEAQADLATEILAEEAAVGQKCIR